VVRAFGPLGTLWRGSVQAAAIATVLLVAGCGGASSSASKAGPATGAATPSAARIVLKVAGNEYSFAPSALKASAGRTTIRFTNTGAVDHDFSIDALHIHLTEKPGKTGEATLTLAPGTYTFFCALPGHRQSGMQGTLTVS
jgi:plastocyanin